MTLTCFKAYDIRGKLGVDIGEDIAYRIGRAYARFLNAPRFFLWHRAGLVACIALKPR